MVFCCGGFAFVFLHTSYFHCFFHNLVIVRIRSLVHPVNVIIKLVWSSFYSSYTRPVVLHVRLLEITISCYLSNTIDVSISPIIHWYFHGRSSSFILCYFMYLSASFDCYAMDENYMLEVAVTFHLNLSDSCLCRKFFLYFILQELSIIKITSNSSQCPNRYKK